MADQALRLQLLNSALRMVGDAELLYLPDNYERAKCKKGNSIIHILDPSVHNHVSWPWGVGAWDLGGGLY